MKSDLSIKDILQKDITRKINGVVKAESNQEETIITELSEYVVTEEIRKHLTKFFDKYVDSLNSSTEDIGVWISGFFGSGKSHLLKMIGRILENKKYGEKKVTEFFESKLKDAILQGNIEKASEVPTDVILFNIDNVSDQDTYQNKDSIAVAFLKKFNEYLGFSRDDIKVAEFERMLWEEGKFEEFKKFFEEESGKTWKDGSRNLDFHADEFLDVIEKMQIMTRESAERWLDKESIKSVSAESFRDLIEGYLKIKGAKQRIVFLVDEIGQYIGENSQLMLNLQTLVETLGVKFQGRVWIGVTSQQDLGTILTANDSRRNDFSKIQDRFKTILPLSSGNIDEVIKKRLLEKREIEREDIENLYEKKRIDIENLISFDKKGMTLSLYKDKFDFAETYPFVGYQFNLLQKVFEKVREMGHSGQHMSRGERSLLSSFQEAGIRVKDMSLGTIVPFNYFYESIEQFLEDNARRPIIHAKNERGIDEFGLEVLKLLFLLKGINGIEPNLNTLASFMINSIECDRINLEAKIKKALEKLEQQVLIQKDGDNYYFLTNEEQDINREVNQEEIDFNDIYKELDSYIFKEIFNKNNISIEETGNKYSFSRKIDEYPFGKPGGQIDIVIFTPSADNYNNIEFIGLREGYDLIIKLPENQEGYMEEIKKSLKIESYIKRKQRENVREAVIRILESKQRENQNRKRRIQNNIEIALQEAEVFIYGHKISIKAKDAGKVIEEALKAAANYRFKNARLIVKKYDENKIKEVLTYDFSGNDQLIKIEKDLETNVNCEAIKEVLNKITIQEKRGMNITLKDLSDYFTKIPYGWDQFSINGIIAELWTYKYINLEESKVIVTEAKEAKELLIKSQNRNLERVVITLKEEIDIELIKKVNNILKSFFGNGVEITNNSPKEELFVILKEKIGCVSKYESEYNEKNYPGKKELKEWKELLKEILFSKGKAEKVLQDFLDMEEELYDLYEKQSTVVDFFTSSKKRKYDEALDKIKRIEEYIDFVGSLKDNSAYNILLEIVRDNNPYSRIREIDDLISAINLEENILIENEKNNLKKKVEKKNEFFSEVLKDRDAILNRVNNNLQDFIEEINKIKDTNIFLRGRKLENIIFNIETEYRNSIKEEINSIEKELISILEDKTDIEELVKEIKVTYNSFKEEVEKKELENLEKIIEMAKKDKDGFIQQSNGKAKKKERIKLRRINVTSKYNLETEEQVQLYITELEREIEELKFKMLEAIKKNKIVDIN